MFSHATELLQRACQDKTSHVFYSTALKGSLQGFQAPWWHSEREAGVLSAQMLTHKKSGPFIDTGTVKETPLFGECATETIDYPN